MPHDQLGMWDETPRECALGSVTSGGLTWSVFLEVRECADRFARGRLIFRRQGQEGQEGQERQERRTADIFVARSVDEVMERAQKFEQHLLRQLVESLA